MSARGVLGAGAALAASAALVACSAVLGFDTFSLDPATTGVEGGPGPGADSAPKADAGIPKCEDADLKTSPYHCGRCDHQCLGASCSNSMCEPIPIGKGLSKPEGLTVTDDYIFVAEFGAGRIAQYDRAQAGKCTGTPCTFVENGNGADRPTGMGSDKTNVYWAGYSSNIDPPGIRSCPITGCTAPKVLAHFATDVLENTFSDEDLLPLQLIVRDEQVFWGQNADGAIQSVKTDGTTISTYLGPNSDYAPIDIAVGDTTIFFTTNGLGTNSAGIFGVPRQLASKAFQVAQAPARTYGMALTDDKKNIFWTLERIGDETFKDGAVQSALSTQMGATQGLGVATAQANARMIQTDAVNVYWIVGGAATHVSDTVLAFTLANSSIVYCPLTGCGPNGPVQLAGGQNLSRHLAQDDTALYWTNEGSGGNDGEVWKLAKP